MKFLCVPCDSPMQLQTVAPPERGSLSIVYACPACGYEIAMLTNAYETQVVQSLGVRIGPDASVSAASGASVVGAAGAPTATVGRAIGTGAGCPFSAMIPGTASVTADDTRPLQTSDPTAISWTAAAEARLANIPSFVRPMARTGIEQFARDRGASEVDEKILDAARDFFGM